MACTSCMKTNATNVACAFDEEGLFVAGGTTCRTMWNLRTLIDDVNGTTLDTVPGSHLGVLSIPDGAGSALESAARAEGDREYHFGGYLVMTWNGERTDVGSAVVMRDDKMPHLLRLDEAEALLKAHRDVTTIGFEPTESADPVLNAIDALRSRGIDEQAIANGLAHLYYRKNRLRHALTEKSATTIMEDQIDDAQVVALSA